MQYLMRWKTWKKKWAPNFVNFPESTALEPRLELMTPKACMLGAVGPAQLIIMLLRITYFLCNALALVKGILWA